MPRRPTGSLSNPNGKQQQPGRTPRAAPMKTTEEPRERKREVRGAIRESVRRSEEAAGRGRPRAESAPKQDRADAQGLPLEDCDSLSVNRMAQKLGELSVEKIERLRDHEAENKGRRSPIDRFDRRIRAAREDLRSSRETEEGPTAFIKTTELASYASAV